MTFLEVLQSGKPFRRQIWKLDEEKIQWVHWNDELGELEYVTGDTFGIITKNQLLATDWENK